ncbi:MAG: HIT family protein [Candidatus Izemoplasmataceae bacterium]|jgi:diadenosine tetraphosphate (Ap4A) HIT family hydrolase|uniref:HIT family protein n=1 Tax=Liberiplasma polymorphum TaxID=3374570 RepID=UPI0037743E53
MCLFCKKAFEIIYENHHMYVIFDSYPVSKGHALIIPKRHIEHYFLATNDEIMSMHDALHVMKNRLDKMYQPDGYNIGINNGEASGQTIFHLHVHLIPRYKGDMDKPQGGVRGVIPAKQKY